jgi:hypothetical protein
MKNLKKGPGQMIPGATDVLGWGFNIFGQCTIKSKSRQLLDLTKDGVRFDSKLNYDVPNSISPSSAKEWHGKNTVCKSTSEVRSSFQSDTNVNGSYGAFSGEVNAHYSKTQMNNTENEYSVYKGLKSSYTLTIKNAASSLISESVLGDPDFTDLMTAAEKGFDPNSPSPFYSFFSKYGTHFINETSMGGRIYYYTSILKTASMNDTEIDVSAKAEYGAAFLTVSAEAEAKWKQVSERWTENRINSIHVIGGDASILAGISRVQRGDSFNDLFKEWVKSVDDDAVPMQFQLAPISGLFSGKIAESISQAILEFTNSKVFASLNFDKAYLHVLNKVTDLPYSALPLDNKEKVFSACITILDRKTAEVVENVAVALDASLPDCINKYQGNSNYVVLFFWAAGIKYPGFVLPVPSTTLSEFIFSAGAGDQFEDLLDLKEPPSYVYPGATNDVYIMAGVIGSKRGNGWEDLGNGRFGGDSPNSTLDLLFIPTETSGTILFTMDES